MPPYETIQLETDPRGFATLWLNRPQKHNAFDAEMIRELILALGTVGDDPGLRFLLLRGHGKHFCAGADLAWMRRSAGLDYAANLDDAHALGELMHTLAGLRLPTLAVVQGAAFGGAVGLVACCDMAIAAEEASFALSEVRIGLVPAVISPFVVQAIGPRATRRYALSAERFDGRQAQALGLIAETCPADELAALSERWVANLLSNGPQAMQVSKALLREVGSGACSPALRQYTEQTIARVRVSAEGQEGLGAFLEKRPPAWQEPHA